MKQQTALFVVYGKTKDEDTVVAGPFWTHAAVQTALEEVQQQSAFPYRYGVRSATFNINFDD